MNKPSKTIDINGVKYAQASEFTMSWSSLERLVETGKTRKVNFSGINYYDVATTTKAVNAMRTVPPGYVKATDYGAQKGAGVHTIRKMCSARGAQAVLCVGAKGRSAWYADKAWLDKKLGIAVIDLKTPPKPEAKPVPKGEKGRPDPLTVAYNLAVILERAELLVAKLEAVLGSTQRDPNTLNISISPSGNGPNGAH